MTLLKLAIETLRRRAALGAGATVNKARKISSLLAKRWRNWATIVGRAFEDKIDVKAGVVFAVGHARERLFVHLLHRLNLAAGGGDFGGDFVDRVLDRLFLAGRV